MAEINVAAGGSSWSDRVTAAVDRTVARLARHWLALFNLIVAAFLLLPFLAPAFMHWHLTGLGRLIYAVYRPTCHQLPERSFFLFGPKAVYTVAELEEANALPSGLTLLQLMSLRFPGTPQSGYKVAICERDVAIYGSILLGGLAFGALRGRLRQPGGKRWKLPLVVYILALAPIAVDGTLQLIGLRESTWLLRLVTGGLFGFATVWFAYPYVEETMADVAASASAAHTPRHSV